MPPVVVWGPALGEVNLLLAGAIVELYGIVEGHIRLNDIEMVECGHFPDVYSGGAAAANIFQMFTAAGAAAGMAGRLEDAHNRFPPTRSLLRRRGGDWAYRLQFFTRAAYARWTL